MLQDIKTRNVNEVIAEIHNEFDTSTERLVKEAQRIANKPHLELVEKANRLSKLGFGASKDAAIGIGITRRMEESKEVLAAVEYFGQHYPNYKFITEKEVKRICDKYGLVLGLAAKYIGDIPEKNIREIEKFELREEDFTEKPFVSWGSIDMNWMYESLLSKYTNEPVKKKETKKEEPKNKRAEFKICAPLKDFNTKDTVVKDGYKMEVYIPDPIVLQPVNNGYLIISKWGLEGQDESLVNEKLN